jgi:hypothetical protein
MLPPELLAAPNWVVRRADKIPLRASDGQFASVTNPGDWTTYDAALRACELHNVELGFVLTQELGITCIDLDNVNDPKFSAEQQAAIRKNQQEIYQSFNSYTEVSPSGYGIHIWCKGTVPNGAKLPSQKIEVYSDSRYFTVTNKPVNDVPMQERQELLTELHQTIRSYQAKTEMKEVESKEQKQDDATIYQMASVAANGDKFLLLWNGDITGYLSQSEADFALIDIIGFYTDNMEQVERMFHASALGQRDKAHRTKKYDVSGQRIDYVGKMVRKSFDRKSPMLNLQAVEQQLAYIAQKKTEELENPIQLEVPELAYDWTCPPGMVGEIASFIFASSVRPVKEVSLAAAIAYFAGMFGRAYNVSGTGLNQYVVILAKTGIGKEAGTSGVSRLNFAVSEQFPAVVDCIGPSTIASPQGLIKHLATKSQCFVSQMGEFGLWLQQVTDKNAKANERGLRRALLDLYNKSGAGDVLNGTVYSDNAKDIPPIAHPSFSLIGDSTPDEFYRALDEANINDGFIPRFTVVEYDGPRPKLNKGHNFVKPDPDMISRLAGQLNRAKQLEGMNQFVTVKLNNPSQEFADKFDKDCDMEINNSDEEFIRMLWNRAHLRVLKLAALLAVGVNANEPEITMLEMRWAHNLVVRGMNTLLARFRSGRIGSQSSADDQLTAIAKTLRKYMDTTWNPKWGAAHRVTQEMHAKRIVSYTYIQHNVSQLACFRHDKNRVLALKQALEDLMRQGALNRFRQADPTAGEAFFIRDIR